MKKLVSLILIVIMCLTSACTAFAESKNAVESSPDFKQFYWGTTKEDVIAIEGTPMLTGDLNGLSAEYIAYETTAVGLDMILAYYFCDEGLYEVRYLLAEDHSNEEKYIEDYKTFKDALAKKYGETALDFENWSNDSKKEYYADDKGNALSYGYLSYSTIWLLDRTYISMSMNADNYDVKMTVRYESSEISPGEADFSGEI